MVSVAPDWPMVTSLSRKPLAGGLLRAKVPFLGNKGVCEQHIPMMYENIPFHCSSTRYPQHALRYCRGCWETSQEVSSCKSVMPVTGSWKSQELCSAEKRAVASKISSKQICAGHTNPSVLQGWLTTTHGQHRDHDWRKGLGLALLGTSLGPG